VFRSTACAAREPVRCRAVIAGGTWNAHLLQQWKGTALGAGRGVSVSTRIIFAIPSPAGQMGLRLAEVSSKNHGGCAPSHSAQDRGGGHLQQVLTEHGDPARDLSSGSARSHSDTLCGSKARRHPSPRQLETITAATMERPGRPATNVASVSTSRPFDSILSSEGATAMC
ncbi:MAG: hypothetical protein ACI8W8_004780, partial [Rhodothermales bacterium]